MARQSSSLALLALAGLGLVLASGAAAASSSSAAGVSPADAAATVDSAQSAYDAAVAQLTSDTAAGYAAGDGSGVIEADQALIAAAADALNNATAAADQAASDATAGVDQNGQLAALLATIRQYESKNNYLILYGSTANTYGLSDHPYFLGWPGVILPPNYCIAAKQPIGCKTTAAGAYQFISTTWRASQNPGSDFSPASQDAAAVNLLTKIGAVAALQAGDVQGAFKAASTQWASMPYSTSGQPKANLTAVLDTFTAAGGIVT
jgi:lysozyme